MITSGFVDLGTFNNNIDVEFYDSSTWRAHVPIKLLKYNDLDDTFIISKGGDWLEYLWIDIDIEPNPNFQPIKNLAHNIFESIDIIFQDEKTISQTVWHVDNIVLDFLMNFNLPTSKQLRYKQKINCNKLSLPLPFNSPIPVHTLSHTDMYLKIKIRDDIKAKITLTPWANYRIENNESRRCNKFKVFIEQYQTRIYSIPKDNIDPWFDLRFNGSVKALLFAIRKKGDLSNYTSGVLQSCSLVYEEIMSTNFDKLTNVSIQPKINNDLQEDYEFIVVSVSKSVLETDKGYAIIIK